MQGRDVRRRGPAPLGAGGFQGAMELSAYDQMLAQPDIDVVAVTVKVPHHRQLVSAALAGIRGGCLNALVTHTDFARQLLNSAG